MTDPVLTSVSGRLLQAHQLHFEMQTEPQAKTAQEVSFADNGVAAMMGTPTVGPTGRSGYFCDSPTDAQTEDKSNHQRQWSTL
jgi:hypothetical protein